MGLLGDILGLADDIVSIPTDFIGLTNHYGKKRAKEILEVNFKAGKITGEEYIEGMSYIEKH